MKIIEGIIIALGIIYDIIDFLVPFFIWSILSDIEQIKEKLGKR